MKAHTKENTKENILIYGAPEPSLMDEVIGKANQKTGSVIVVVPDQFKLETEQELLKMLGRPLLHVKVMSFTGVARKVLSAEDIVPISHVGKRLFLIKILNENKDRLRIFGRHVHKQGFIRELGEILGEMTEELKLPENIEITTADKIHDINLIYREYAGISEKYIGDEKLIGLASRNVSDSEFVRESEFYIMRYDFFTKNEHALYLELLKYAKGVKMTLLCDDKNVYAYTQRLLNKMPSSVQVKRAGESAPTASTAVERAIVSAENPILGNQYSFFHTLSESMFAQDLDALRDLLRKYVSDEDQEVSTGANSEKPEESEESEGATKSTVCREGEVNVSACRECAANIAAGGEGRIFFSADSPIEVYELETRYDEAEYVAGRILNLIESGIKPSEMTVVLPKREAYDGVLERIFARKNIPFFVDRDRIFDESPLSKFISALIDYNLAPNQKHLAAMLATEIFPIGAEKSLKFHLLAEERRLNPDPDFQRILESLRFRGLEGSFFVADFVKELYRILTTKVEYRGRTLSIMERCEKHSFSMRRMAKEATAEIEYGARIWNSFMNILDELYELSGICGEINLPIARLLIDTGTRVARVPNQKEYVSITSPDRIRPLRSAYCFVLGALRGELPSSAQSKGVFTPEEQDAILEMERMTQFFDYEKESYHMHLLLTTPSEKLIFTYPQGNCSILLSYILEALGGKGFLKKKAGTDFSDSAPGNGEIVLPEFRLRTSGETPASDESDISAESRNCSESPSSAPDSRQIRLSQSKIQNYLNCPLCYCIDYEVKAKEQRVNELSGLDSGNIVHRIMEIYVSFYPVAEDMKSLTPEELADKIGNAGEEYLKRIEEIYRRIAREESVVTADMKEGELFQRRFIEACAVYAQVIDFQIASGEFAVELTEGKIRGKEHFSGDFEEDFRSCFPELFEMEEVPERSPEEEEEEERMKEQWIAFMNRGGRRSTDVYLEGTFDRMDRTSDTYRLIDYKTSNNYDGKLMDLFNLDYIQLGLYAYLLSLEDVKVLNSEEVGTEAGGAGNHSVEGMTCDGLHILNLVNIHKGCKEIDSEKSTAKSGETLTYFRKYSMQGMVNMAPEAEERYFRGEGVDKVVRSRKAANYINYRFTGTGVHSREQRFLLKYAFLLAFREFDANRSSMVSLLKEAGKYFHLFLTKGEAGGMVEFDIIVLWSRILTWSVAKGIAMGEFEPNLNETKRCGYCNYKAICQYELRRG